MTKALLLGAVALSGLASNAQAAEIYYQAGFTNNLYLYDTDTAVEAFIGNLGLVADSVGLAFSPGGTLYAFDRGTQSLYTVNTATAATTLVGFSGIGAEDFAISLDGTTGYATDGGLYSIDLGTGAATFIGGDTMDGLTTAPVAVTINGTPYAAGSLFGVDSGSFFSIDAGTGAATFLGSIFADETLAFGADGTLYGHNDQGSLTIMTLDPLSSAILAATTPTLVFGMAVAPGVIPEPSTWAMMIAGFGLAGGALRRRQSVRVAYA